MKHCIRLLSVMFAMMLCSITAFAAPISITAGSVIPSAQAKTVLLYAGTTITAGQAVYSDSAGVLQLTDSDASATAAQCIGIALNGGSTGQPIVVCTEDMGGLTIGGTVAAGDTIYTSPTAGGVTKTQADVVAGNYTIILGVAFSTTKIYLQILRSGVTHA